MRLLIAVPKINAPFDTMHTQEAAFCEYSLPKPLPEQPGEYIEISDGLIGRIEGRMRIPQ